VNGLTKTNCVVYFPFRKILHARKKLIHLSHLLPSVADLTLYEKKFFSFIVTIYVSLRVSFCNYFMTWISA